VYSLSFVTFSDLVAGPRYEGYSSMDQAISELSAVGAPTRPLLAALVPIWSALLIACGIGVARAAKWNRPLRVTGGLLIAHGVVTIHWLWFPMTAREEIGLHALHWNDLGHLAVAGWSAVFGLAEIGFGAAAFGKHFRVYSLVTLVIGVVFGVLTSTQAANLADGDPTPLMGLYERVCVGAWLLWIAIVSVILVRSRGRAPVRASAGPLPDAARTATA
jgi:hypothetical protein